MSLYDDLGVNKGASRDAIKRAFRKKAMRAHPDRGGKPEEFRKIEKAYAVLYDPARRERYDQHGQENAPPEQSQDLIVLAQLLIAVIENSPVETTDILRAVSDHIHAKQSEIKTSVKNLHRQADKFRRAAQRLSRKSDGPNVLLQMLESRIEHAETDCVRAEAHLETGERILKLLSEYSYQVDPTVDHPRGSLPWMIQNGMGVQVFGR